jgi:hypothetical protein
MIPFSPKKAFKSVSKTLSPSQILRLAIIGLWEQGVTTLSSEQYYEKRMSEFTEQIQKEKREFLLPKDDEERT